MSVTPINIRQAQQLHRELVKGLAQAKAEQARIIRAIASAQLLLDDADSLVLRLQADIKRLSINGDAF